MHKVRTCAEDRQITQDCQRILGSICIVKPKERVDTKLTMATTQQQNLPLHVVLEWCDDLENGIVRGRSSGRQVGLKAVAESFSVDPMSFASSTCSPSCPLVRLL